jgi:hypothetical protein
MDWLEAMPGEVFAGAITILLPIPNHSIKSAGVASHVHSQLGFKVPVRQSLIKGICSGPLRSLAC